MAIGSYKQGDGEHQLLKKILSRLEQIDGVTASTRRVDTSGSLTGGGDLSEDRTLSLVNDSDAPGLRKYYGTDGTGTKGFYTFSNSLFDGAVDTWGDLPVSVLAAPVGSLYVVLQSSGIWFVDRKEAGTWYRATNGGTSADWVRLGNFDEMMIDDNLRIRDNGDMTREVGFELSGISSGATRIISFPDRDGTLAFLDDIAGRQPLSSELTAINALSSTGFLKRLGSGSWATVNLATVATSGDYNDLANLPSLAAVAISGHAADVTYDHTVSGLVAADVQDAIDELAANTQPLDADLTAIAALSTTAFGRALLTKVDAAAVRTYIGAGTSSFSGAFSDLSGVPTTIAGYGIIDAQPLDSDLTAIAALATDAFGRALLTKTDAGSIRTYIGAGTSSFSGVFTDLTSIPTTLAGYGITDGQPLDSDLTAIAALTTTPFGRALLTQADAAATRATIGAGTSSFDGVFSSLTSKPTTLSGYGITDGQPMDADLTAIAALTTDSFGRALLTKTDGAAIRTYIGAGTSSFSGVFTDLTSIPTTLAGYGITDAQSKDVKLTSIAALASAAGWLHNDGAGVFAYTTPTKADVGLGSVENTALSTWAGSVNITTLGTIAAGTWGAATIALSKGGTGQTTKVAAFDALSPFSALGDMLYGGASGTGTALAGNTTATKKFLNQTGTGTVSAAPAWSALVAADIPSLSGTYALTGAVTGSGLAMSTAHLLGRTTASTGAIEELTIGTSLSFSAGSLNTIQGIQTTDTPQFARLGIGLSADPTFLLSVAGLGVFDLMSGTAAPSTEGSSSLFTMKLRGSDSTATRLQSVSYSGTGNSFSGLTYGGTRASPAATTDGTILFRFNGQGFDGTATGTGMLFTLTADGLWSSTNHGGYITWAGVSNGATANSEWMRLQNANLGVGGAADSDSRIQLSTPSGASTVLRLTQASTASWWMRIPTSTNALSFGQGGGTGTEYLRISSAGTLTIVGGIAPDGGGTKHKRVSTGSISGASSSLITVTWGTAFADTNYTVEATVQDSTTSSLSLTVVHIESVTASAVTVRVLNNSAGALTGTLHVVAIHD